MSATPRPWQVNDDAYPYSVQDEDENVIATMVLRRKDADFIVRAVNAHDALVAALDDLIYAYVTDRWNQGITRDRIDAEPTVKAARDALKLADVVTQPPRTPDVAP